MFLASVLSYAFLPSAAASDWAPNVGTSALDILVVAFVVERLLTSRDVQRLRFLRYQAMNRIGAYLSIAVGSIKSELGSSATTIAELENEWSAVIRTERNRNYVDLAVGWLEHHRQEVLATLRDYRDELDERYVAAMIDCADHWETIGSFLKVNLAWSVDPESISATYRRAANLAFKTEAEVDADVIRVVQRNKGRSTDPPDEAHIAALISILEIISLMMYIHNDTITAADPWQWDDIGTKLVNVDARSSSLAEFITSAVPGSTSPGAKPDTTAARPLARRKKKRRRR